MTRRRLLRAGPVLLGLAIATLVLLWLTRPGRGITHGNFKLLQKGMTEEEVVAILGCPAGAYTDEATHDMPFSAPGHPTSVKEYVSQLDCAGIPEWCAGRKGWYGDDLFVWVHFGQDGRADWFGCANAYGGPFRPLARLRAMLGW